MKDQSLANYHEVSETYDEATGAYKFNTPMMGFGAGAYMLAMSLKLVRVQPPGSAVMR